MASIHAQVEKPNPETIQAAACFALGFALPFAFLGGCGFSGAVGAAAGSSTGRLAGPFLEPHSSL